MQGHVVPVKIHPLEKPKGTRYMQELFSWVQKTEEGSYQRKVGVGGGEQEVGEFVDVGLCLQMEVLPDRRLHFYKADVWCQ